MPNLDSPIDAGALSLKNRVFMAPLTRNRAQPDGTPGDLAATYYRQRSTAGLIITEATQISAMGKGYINTPGIYTPAHVKAWHAITDAVHAQGGRIFLQLWHVGRISHESLLPGGTSPVAPSAIRAKSRTVTESGFVDVSTPRALTLDEIKATVEDYRQAARNAQEAGFDGVEIHAANGYLIDQFLQTSSNTRTDAYGGSIENRLRFLLEVTEAVASVWSPDRITIRLSPRGTFNDMGDADPAALFTAAVRALAGSGLAHWLHVVEAAPGDGAAEEEFRSLFSALRRAWPGAYVANGGYDGKRGEAALRDGDADAIAYGRLFLANPDLPRRLVQGAPLNTPDEATFYGGGAHGYTDYPALDEKPAAA